MIEAPRTEGSEGDEFQFVSDAESATDTVELTARLEPGAGLSAANSAKSYGPV